MQSSNAPNKISLPFASSGTKNTIPVPSQQGVTPGAASFTDGFPPLTFTPLSAGGVPPSGADFNGVLNAITALQQWKSAGGQFPFDATFAAAIGGYPKGATVLKADGTGLWISTAENNTANPDTGGAGWLAFSASAIQSGSYSSAQDTGTANAYAMTLSPAPAALTPGMVVTLQNIKATNTAASTLNVNGLGALPINVSNGTALGAGSLNIGSDAVFELNLAATAWSLVWTSGLYASPHGRQMFYSSANFTVPLGVSTVYVSACAGGGGGGAGGGGGGNYYGSGAGGGAGGQFVIGSAVSVSPGQIIPATIGAGGVGGIANSGIGGSGADGGTTSFGSLVVLAGGGGGQRGNNGSSTSLPGAPPGIGYTNGEYGEDSQTTGIGTGNGGAGGGSPFGAPGGRGKSSTTSGAAGGAGNNGTGFGSGGGGGGAYISNNGPATATNGGNGGNGAPGILIVEW